MEEKTQTTLQTDFKRWVPRQVLFTSDALKSKYGEEIYAKVNQLGIKTIVSGNNRLTGIKGQTDAETYRNAKSTLAIVNAPPGQFRLQPIPPSADFQFHLAQGCPAHCQYCYLAGSLKGLPVVKAYVNLDEILDNTRNYESKDKVTSFEASCYTDPLSLEHLTGSLSHTIQHFAERPNAHLRWVTKFDNVDPLLQIGHNNRTRCRISLNVEEIVKGFETGAANLNQRLVALQKLISHNYPVGLVLAPIMPVDDWKIKYHDLFFQLGKIIPDHTDLTLEYITHRFTPGSKEILLSWYPNTKLSLEESERKEKFTKFGGKKYVYKTDIMKEMKGVFKEYQEQYLPFGKALYWT